MIHISLYLDFSLPFNLKSILKALINFNISNILYNPGESCYAEKFKSEPNLNCEKTYFGD